MTTIAFYNNARETFVTVRANAGSVDFITMRSGTIDIENIEEKSELGLELKAAPKDSQNIQRIAEQLSKSVLPKTPRAIAVLAQIKANTDKSRVDFLTAADETLQKINSTSKVHRSGHPVKAKKDTVKANPRKAEGMFSLADLARELSLDPREVRAKFRKANMVKPEAGWVFPNNRRKEILSLVKGESKAAPKANKAKAAEKVPPVNSAKTKASTKNAPVAQTKRVRVNLRAGAQEQAAA